MYDKTIASDYRIYSITLTGTPTIVYNLFDATTKSDYDNIVGGNGLLAKTPIGGRPKQQYKRNVVDGYIESYGNSFNIYSDAYPTINAYEIVASNTQYTIPVYDWPIKTYISGSGDVILRIFFS